MDGEADFGRAGKAGATGFRFGQSALAIAGLGLLVAVAALVFTLPGPDGSRPAAAADASLERLVAEAARHLDAQAPFATAGATAVGVSAEGNRLVYRMTLADEVPVEETEAVRARLEAANAAELCAGADTRRMIELGGAFEHRYAAPSGDAFRTEVASCAGRNEAEKSSLPMAM